jgi:hypothetical protein
MSSRLSSHSSMQCAQCGAEAEEICEFCRRPVCSLCRIEDYDGHPSELYPPEVRHAMCVGYWTPGRRRGQEWRRQQREKGGS